MSLWEMYNNHCASKIYYQIARQLMSIFESSNLPLTIPYSRSAKPQKLHFTTFCHISRIRLSQYDLCTWGLAKIEIILDVDS